MYGKLTMYQKMNVIVIFLLAPIILLSLYSSRTSNDVIRHEIEKSSDTTLALLSHQIDASANQLTTLALSLNRDPSVRTFSNATYAPGAYNRYFVMSNLSEKLGLTSASTNWLNIVTVHAPGIKENVSSTLNFPKYDAKYLERKFTPSWSYQPADFHYGRDDYFVRFFTETAYNDNRPPTDYSVVTEVSFSKRNLVKLLDLFKAEDNINDPLLYKPGEKPIMNSTSHSDMTGQLLTKLDEAALRNGGSTKVVIDGEEYMTTIQKSDTLEWYLIDYVPVDDILAPIRQSSLLFYTTLAILIVIGSALSYTIYKNVQQPILMLVGTVRALMRGDYSKRITYYSGHHEFQYLIDQFNLMAQQIQELIEKVYESRIRMQEAKLKQLQSQIDPHFLYNCLNFMKNSARMKDEESVVHMSIHLGEYYRYATRLEGSVTTLAQELRLIENYLEIHKLRLHELEYEMNIPAALLLLPVPRLILQPLVENAIQHGVEAQTDAGRIRISGSREQGRIRLSVEDNGPGLSSEVRNQLERKIRDSSNEEQLCGLWNVSQRVMLQFGRVAAVTLASSELGGLMAAIEWDELEGAEVPEPPPDGRPDDGLDSSRTL
ncbi:histidine kinase [Paenibacillus sp. GCM10023252]|uniref:sensor histidine kinase n=1 Tax=Paenibacillus sp. GCM10023252 TaxID=3252649 RepID=UPI0036092345